MKNLIFLIVLGVAGYFGYQYFGIPWLEGNNSTKTTFNMSLLPEKCQQAGESLKDAFNRHETGEINQVSVNGFTQNFRRCLRQEGLTDSQINEAYDGIKDSS